MRSPIMLSLTLALLTSCSGSSDGGNGGPPATGVTTPVDATTGAATVNYDPASTSNQTINIASGSSLTGTQIIIAPGTFALAAPISVEEGGAAASSISLSVGVTEAPVTASPSVIVRTTDTTLIPKTPVAISLPLTPGLGLVQNKLVVLSLVWTDSGVKALVIPTDKITLAAGKAKFDTAFFGQFQLAYLSEIPTTLEAKATGDIVSKKEASVPQNVYMVGGKDDPNSQDGYGIGAFAKNGVWTNLSLVEPEGSAEPYNIIGYKGKVIISGFYTSGPDEQSIRKTTPGVWIDNVWTAYPVSEAVTVCDNADLAIDAAGRLNVSATCNTAAQSEITFQWLDGILQPNEDIFTWNLSSDRLGNIYRTQNDGYFVNSKYVQLLTGEMDHVIGRAKVNLKGEVHIAAEKTNPETSERSLGYFKDSLWIPTDSVYSDELAFTPGQELIRVATRRQGLFLYVGAKESQMECVRDTEGSTEGIYIDGIAVDRDGNVYTTGQCNDKNGYWKNTKFFPIEAYGAGDITVF